MAFVSSIPLATRPFTSPFQLPNRPHVSPVPSVPTRVRLPKMDLPLQGIYSQSATPANIHVTIFGATGYIGRIVTKQFIEQGYIVTAFARDRSGVGSRKTRADVQTDFEGARLVFGDVTNPSDVARAFDDHQTDVVVSCLASRTGGIEDSNLIDYSATSNVLHEARRASVAHFVLLSAVCVQKPLLEFQRAKLKFEAELVDIAQQDDAFSYCIVRPTAFFKSLAGQIERVKNGSAYVMFGNGDLCKCNALSERDLAKFMVLCAEDVEKRNQILPVGGPGQPVTPKEQAEIIFRLIGKKPKYLMLPIGIMDGAIGLLDALATFLPFLKDPAEFGKIGKYYAVEDMVAPSFGQDTLEQFFEKALQEGGLKDQELGDAAVF